MRAKHNIFRLLLTMVLCAVVQMAAAQTSIKKLSLKMLDDRTRISIDMNADAEHFVHFGDDERQVVLVIYNSQSRGKLDRKIKLGNIQQITSRQRGKDLWLTFDLLEPVRARSFVIKPNKHSGHKLVVEFSFDHQQRTGTLASNKLDIVIDPGHGGEDPGASGALGTQEKIVTLSIAHKLARLFRNDERINIHLTRQSDTYVSLKNRVRHAEQVKADLFISIHADQYKDPRISGASVYVLSEKSNSSEMASWLEKLEADSDFLSTEDTAYKSDSAVQQILSDLSEKANKHHSNKLAMQILNQLNRSLKTHSKQPQKARFYVLRHADIPAILVEVGFMSNKQEERLLMTERYQNKLAKALYRAIKKYIDNPQ